MDIEDLKTVKKFLKRYKDELSIECTAYDEILSFVKIMIKDQTKDQIVHMDDNVLQVFISDTVDEYFRKNNKMIDPFGCGKELISDERIERRKNIIVKEIKDHMDDCKQINGKIVFSYYLGCCSAFSEEFLSFKYDMLQTYYQAIGADFEGGF